MAYPDIEDVIRQGHIAICLPAFRSQQHDLLIFTSHDGRVPRHMVSDSGDTARLYGLLRYAPDNYHEGAIELGLASVYSFVYGTDICLSRSRASIAAVHPQVRTGDIVRGIGQKEGDGSHEILGDAHLALRDERRPLCLQIRVIVENLLCPAGRGVMIISIPFAHLERRQRRS